MSNIVTYSRIRDTLGSFDIINTEHRDLFLRWIGHTAMVYRSPETGQLSVYESTTQNKFSGKSGVQLTPMGLWLHHYPGRVKIRRVTIPDHIFCGARDRLQSHIRRYRGSSYPDLKTRWGRWLLIKAKWDSWLLKKQSTNPDIDSVFFCTHLFAHAWEYCYLTVDIIATEFEPDDTRPGGKFVKYILPGIEIEDEIRIK